jgi:hypothetical protein
MAVFNTLNTLSNSTGTNTGEDYNAPYSFQDWKVRNTNIPPGDLFNQYNAYLKNWYINRNVANVVSTDYVKQYYKTFLRTLGITARTNAEKQLFENVDINDPSSLQSVIVGYARRLKDITVYLANKRNDIYYSKLKNNLTGTSTSLERMFYSYLLNAFTRKTTPDGIITTSFIVTSPDILDALPYLDTITQDFNIQIEEVYDTSNYFDRDPSVSISNYTATASGIPDALYSASSYSVPEEYLIASTIEAVAITNSTSMTTTLPAYWTFIGDGSTTTYALSNLTSDAAYTYQVTIEGVVQTPDESYTVSTVNQNIVFSEPPPVNGVIVIVKRY